MRRWWVILLVAIPIFITGCTTYAKQQNELYEDTTLAASILPSITQTASQNTSNEATAIAELDAMAKALSGVGIYKLDSNDCTDYTLRFLGNATKYGHTCRYVSGIHNPDWHCHSWVECRIGNKDIWIETTQGTDSVGFIDGNRSKSYIKICDGEWNGTQWQSISRCESTVCGNVLKQKYLNNSDGNVNN